MSLIGSLNTAVGGMTAQSTALGEISNNVANSQTVGFKGSNTTFADYVTGSGAVGDGVVASSRFTNSQQGSVTQVSSPTSLAISGAGLFSVSQLTGTSPQGSTSFSAQPFYTRVGDFEPNSAGYLVNSTGYVLNGWPATGSGAAAGFDTNALSPVQISKAPSAPVATTTMSVAANLPASPTIDTATTPYTSSMQIRDANGTAQTVSLSWSQVGSVAPGSPISASNPAVPNVWNLTVSGGTPTGSPATTPSTGALQVTFGSTPADAGRITSITVPGTPGTIPASVQPGSKAVVTLPFQFGLGTQPVALSLGTYGSSDGVTQFSGTDYNVSSQSQDGSAQGEYSSLTVKPTGDIVVNYDNGTNRTVARIPLVTFNNPDGLAAQDGQTFTATTDSGSANVVGAATNGAGSMVVGAVEASNVDIASQFTNMIVAQRAYTANSKVVTTANALMQDTLNMVQG